MTETSGWLRLTEHDRARLRTTRRLFIAGIVLGMLGAGALGLMGLDGRVGLATVLVGSALGAVVAALVTVLVAILDESRRAPVAISRMLIAVGLFALGAFLFIAVLGLAERSATQHSAGLGPRVATLSGAQDPRARMLSSPW